MIALKRSPYVLTTNLEGINTPVDDFELYQNYPNPFNPETRIPVRLTKPSAVSLTIFNVAGERIKTLFGGFLASGAYDFRWDSRDNTGKPVSTGLYIYRINCGGILQERKMMLIK